MDEAFPDNWTYLRTELNWLDRVLAGAIARQKKDTKAVERVSKARVDQVTSHWWRGLIEVEGPIAGDSPAAHPSRNNSTVTHQQRMADRIEASRRRSIVLGLPSLCQQLQLSTFEKNLLLFSLAPEVSRRYGRIYNFLQDPDHPGASGLPTVDLILRLLCRNDREWSVARLSLSSHAKLVQQGIVILPATTTEPLLSTPVKLAAAIADYCLAESPQLTTLERFLSPDCQPSLALGQSEFALPEVWRSEAIAPSFDRSPIPEIVPQPVPTTNLWQTLILPDHLQTMLRHLCDRVQFGDRVNQLWTNDISGETSLGGTIALFTGAAGTGKTLAVRAIAQLLEVPLVMLDLAVLPSNQSKLALDRVITESPPILLLKSAHYWFGRSSYLPAAHLHQFLHTRQQSRSLTILSTNLTQPVRASWYASFSLTLNFPLPTRSQRVQLWQQAFPATVPLSQDMNWQDLAQVPISGGTIQTIAQEAAIVAMAEGNSPNWQIEMRHIWQACRMLGIPVSKNKLH